MVIIKIVLILGIPFIICSIILFISILYGRKFDKDRGVKPTWWYTW